MSLSGLLERELRLLRDRPRCQRCEHLCVKVRDDGYCMGCSDVLSYEAAGSPRFNKKGQPMLPPAEPKYKSCNNPDCSALERKRREDDNYRRWWL